jgi:hypothetical protein
LIEAPRGANRRRDKTSPGGVPRRSPRWVCLHPSGRRAGTLAAGSGGR